MKILGKIADALQLASSASIDYWVYDDRGGSEIVIGSGGMKTVVGSYDFWGIGNPPGHYQRLGVLVVDDPDHVFENQRIQAALVDAIEAANGSAAVVVSRCAAGLAIGTPMCSTRVFSLGCAFPKKQQRYEIVRYLD